MIGTLAVDGWMVQRGGAWAGWGPTHFLLAIKCNNPSISSQCTNFILFDVALLVPIKGLRYDLLQVRVGVGTSCSASSVLGYDDETGQ